jgi:hypothetical protein
MIAYKLTLAFNDLNKVIDLYTTGLKKPKTKVLAMIASMGSKGQIVSNPDNTVAVTWYFRSLDKYNNILDTYLKCNRIPDYYIPGTKRINYQVE